MGVDGSHPGGFVVAGRELVALGHEKSWWSADAVWRIWGEGSGNEAGTVWRG